MAEDSKNYVLIVPLDASNVKDFEPTRPVRVVAYSAKAGTHQEIVRLDKTGKGRASSSLVRTRVRLRLPLGRKQLPQRTLGTCRR